MRVLDVLDVQRARILAAMVEVLAEDGGAGMVTVARVVSRAGVSRRTFYDLFEGCEDCFLAVFDDALELATRVAVQAAENAPSSWREQIRAGLCALLTLFDEEPALGSLLIVDALSAGPEVLQRRAHALQTLTAIIDQGGHSSTSRRRVGTPGSGKGGATSRSGGGGGETSSASFSVLTAEGVVGAVLSVIHARILERHTRVPSRSRNGRISRYPREPVASLIELLNPLMGVIVLPYLGQAAARRELEQPPPKTTTLPSSAPQRSSRGAPNPSPANPLVGLNMRITYRTLQVLRTIAETPGASNRQIADHAGIHDQGQISKLLTRLQRLGLIHNTTQGQPQGEPNAWTLTPHGQQLQQTLNPNH